ncbi:MAG: shikimate kinase [Verrucomicrobiota bacterium]
MGAVQNVVLVGFMGTGKTTVGQKVAKSLGYQFVDTDALVEEVEGRSIPDIFAQEGEEGFRGKETEVLQRALQQDHAVISTGGGAVLRKENRKLIQEGGFCVWLTASAEDILERVMMNTNRPLLQTKDPLETIQRMLSERHDFYVETADLILETTELHPDDVAYGICESARVYFQHRVGE